MFQTMERLLDPEEGDEIDIPTAKAVAECGKVLVESLKAESQFLKITSQKRGSGFITVEDAQTLEGGDHKLLGS